MWHGHCRPAVWCPLIVTGRSWCLPQAYIHKSRVLLFNEAASDSKVETDIISIKDLTNVTQVRGHNCVGGVVEALGGVADFGVRAWTCCQVKWVSPAGSPQLFVCMGSGIQVYETKQEHTSTRMAMLFSDPLCERMEAAEGVSRPAPAAHPVSARYYRPANARAHVTLSCRVVQALLSIAAAWLRLETVAMWLSAPSPARSQCTAAAKSRTRC